METIIKNLGKYNIDIDNDYTDIVESNLTDAEKIMKFSYLVGKCMGKIRCVQLDLMNLKEIEDARNNN